MWIFKSITEYISWFFRTIDKLTLFLCLLLSGASIFFLYGLFLVDITNSARAITQSIAVVIGLLAALFISNFNYKTLAKFWKLFLPSCLIAILLTYIFGSSRGSNQAWLWVTLFGKSFSVQPSEFLKISFIVTFSLHLNHVGKDINKLKNVALLGMHGFAHILLIVLQRDDGTAIVFMGIFLIMIFVAGLSWKYLLVGIAVVAGAVPLVWFKFMSLDQQMRFLVLKDPSISEKYAYQQMQGLKALGVGGITGVGFSGKSVYVPESYNDFIFTFIGQSAGIVGCLAVIIVLSVLCYKLIYNGNHAQDITGRMICVGVMGIIMVQSIMNIGMCINLLPVIGVPLPFLSAGGSSVVALYLGIGLVLSVSRFKEKGMFGEKKHLFKL